MPFKCLLPSFPLALPLFAATSEPSKPVEFTVPAGTRGGANQTALSGQPHFDRLCSNKQLHRTLMMEAGSLADWGQVHEHLGKRCWRPQALAWTRWRASFA